MKHDPKRIDMKLSISWGWFSERSYVEVEPEHNKHLPYLFLGVYPGWHDSRVWQLRVETGDWWFKAGKMPVGRLGERLGWRIRLGMTYEKAWAKA